MLNSSPKHKKLCHGNLTPHNIIIKDDNIYVTDWNHASQGNASADVANTYLLLKLVDDSIAEKYMQTFCNKTNTKKDYVTSWVPIVAAARLTKNNPAEKELLEKWIDIVEFQ